MPVAHAVLMSVCCAHERVLCWWACAVIESTCCTRERVLMMVCNQFPRMGNTYLLFSRHAEDPQTSCYKEECVFMFFSLRPTAGDSMPKHFACYMGPAEAEANRDASYMKCIWTYKCKPSIQGFSRILQEPPTHPTTKKPHTICSDEVHLVRHGLLIIHTDDGHTVGKQTTTPSTYIQEASSLHATENNNGIKVEFVKPSF